MTEKHTQTQKLVKPLSALPIYMYFKKILHIAMIRKKVEVWPFIPKDDSILAGPEEKNKTKQNPNYSKSEILGQSQVSNIVNLEFLFLIKQSV